MTDPSTNSDILQEISDSRRASLLAVAEEPPVPDQPAATSLPADPLDPTDPPLELDESPLPGETPVEEPPKPRATRTRTGVK